MFAKAIRHKRSRTNSLDRGSTRKTAKVEYSVPIGNRFNVLNNNTKEPIVKVNKPAPITVTNNDTDISAILKEIKVQYRIKLISVGTKIFVDTEAEFKSICKLFRTKKVEFFTHPFGNLKMFKLILCGLPEVPTTEISEWLKSQNNVNVTKISMLNTNGSFKKYILQFDPNENSKSDIKNIKVIMNHVIKWLPTKPHKKGPTQCHKCGMFGHGIMACFRTPRCNLCGEGHESKSCSFNSQEDSQRIYKCHNCKASNLPHNHKADDLNCPMRIKYIEIKNTANKRKSQSAVKQFQSTAAAFPQLTPAPPPPPLTRSFANVASQHANTQFSATNGNPFANNPNQQTCNRHTATDATPYANNNNLFSFAEVSEIMINCVNELQHCTCKLDQIKVIANLLNYVCK